VKRSENRSPSPIRSGNLALKRDEKGSHDVKDILKKIKLNSSQVNMVKTSASIDPAIIKKKKITLTKT
jgi:hypothetical protein